MTCLRTRTLPALLFLGVALCPAQDTVRTLLSGRVIEQRGVEVTLLTEGGFEKFRLGDGVRPRLLPGDHVYAAGERSAAGMLTASDVQVNLVNLYGKITAVDRDSFELWPYALEPLGYRVRCVLQRDGATQRMQEACASCGIRPAMFAQVVGQIAADGTISVTRLWLYPDRPADRRR